MPRDVDSPNKEAKSIEDKGISHDSELWSKLSRNVLFRSSCASVVSPNQLEGRVSSCALVVAYEVFNGTG